MITIITSMLCIVYLLYYVNKFQEKKISGASSGVNYIPHIRSYLEHYNYQNIIPAIRSYLEHYSYQNIIPANYNNL